MKFYWLVESGKAKKKPLIVVYTDSEKNAMKVTKGLREKNTVCIKYWTTPEKIPEQIKDNVILWLDENGDELYKKLYI